MTVPSIGMIISWDSCSYEGIDTLCHITLDCGCLMSSSTDKNCDMQSCSIVKLPNIQVAVYPTNENFTLLNWGNTYGNIIWP